MSETVNKRYYWLKLREGFFGQKEIKRLRKIAGGDTYTIIYLKMLLRSLSNNGFLYFDNVEENFVAELALDLDESEENVAITVQYLTAQGILVESSEDEFLLTTCSGMVGSETASTIRSRKSREKQKALQCNTIAAIGNTEKEIEKEKEAEREQEKEAEPKRTNYQFIADMYNDTCVSFPRLTKLSESRKKAIKARLNTYSIEDFKRLFEKAEASSFLKGKNDRNWSASFDWMVKDANMAKVLEGNYDDKHKAAPKSNAFNNYPQRQYDYEAMERMLLTQQAPPETAATNPDIKARAEALQKELGGS